VYGHVRNAGMRQGEGKSFLTHENWSVGRRVGRAWSSFSPPSRALRGENNLLSGVRCLPANKIVKVQAQMKINRAVQMRAALALSRDLTPPWGLKRDARSYVKYFLG